MLELNDSTLGGAFLVGEYTPHPTDYSGQKHNRRHKNGHSKIGSEAPLVMDQGK